MRYGSWLSKRQNAFETLFPGRDEWISLFLISGYLDTMDTWCHGYLDIMVTWISRIPGCHGSGYHDYSVIMDAWIVMYHGHYFFWIHGYLNTMDPNFYIIHGMDPLVSRYPLKESWKLNKMLQFLLLSKGQLISKRFFGVVDLRFPLRNKRK